MIASDLEGYLNLRESQSPMLRARAEMLFQSFKRYRPVLKSSARLVPKPEMAEQIRELLARLEKASRKTGLIRVSKRWGSILLAGSAIFEPAFSATRSSPGPG